MLRSPTSRIFAITPNEFTVGNLEKTSLEDGEIPVLGTVHLNRTKIEKHTISPGEIEAGVADAIKTYQGYGIDSVPSGGNEDDIASTFVHEIVDRILSNLLTEKELQHSLGTMIEFCHEFTEGSPGEIIVEKVGDVSILSLTSPELESYRNDLFAEGIIFSSNPPSRSEEEASIYSETLDETYDGVDFSYETESDDNLSLTSRSYSLTSSSDSGLETESLSSIVSTPIDENFNDTINLEELLEFLMEYRQELTNGLTIHTQTIAEALQGQYLVLFNFDLIPYVDFHYDYIVHVEKSMKSSATFEDDEVLLIYECIEDLKEGSTIFRELIEKAIEEGVIIIKRDN